MREWKKLTTFSKIVSEHEQAFSQDKITQLLMAVFAKWLKGSASQQLRNSTLKSVELIVPLLIWIFHHSTNWNAFALTISHIYWTDSMIVTFHVPPLGIKPNRSNSTQSSDNFLNFSGL